MGRAFTKTMMLTGTPVWYWLHGNESEKPYVGVIHDINQNGIADILIQRVGSNDMRKCIRHCRDPYLRTHPNVAGLDGTWDYIPTDAEKIYPAADGEKPKAESVVVSDPKVVHLERELDELKKLVSDLTAPTAPAAPAPAAEPVSEVVEESKAEPAEAVEESKTTDPRPKRFSYTGKK